MICIIHDCVSPVLAKSYCRKHYLRQYKHGSPYIKKKPLAKRGKESHLYKHGKWNHPLYKTWTNMIDRCENNKNKAWNNYGGRGIKVCSRWHDINSFIEDMGHKRTGQSIDRIDGDKGYCKDNCRWASPTQQSRNRKFCKLDLDQARMIRAEKRRGKNGRGPGMTRLEIAGKYNVSLATIKKVLSMMSWKENHEGV